MPKCSLLHPPAPRPAGLLTLNRKSPSHDSDPDPEVFWASGDSGLDQTGDEWGARASKTTRKGNQTAESSGPATRKMTKAADDGMFYHVPAKELCKDQLPSQDDVLMHQEYLIQQGTMGRRGDKRVKAAILGLAVAIVWKDLELLTAICGQSMTRLSSSCRL